MASNPLTTQRLMDVQRGGVDAVARDMDNSRNGVQACEGFRYAKFGGKMKNTSRMVFLR
jgi:hypothetical protein